MKTISFLFIALVLLLNSCAEKQKLPIAQAADYESYLVADHNESLRKCNDELAFWENRLVKTPDSETCRLKKAGLLASRFMLTGEIEDIDASDSLYNTILNKSNEPHAGIHRSLAANCITRHKFMEAYQQINTALEIGEGKAASLYMLVDVSLELGDYGIADKTLRRVANKNQFAYLIRKAKLLDHDGDLDSAIIVMETALNKVKETPSLYLWTQSNLADMYGHAGRVDEAYSLYLDILKTNPDYDYALKGIAWIAFSHDHNYNEANRIANFINDKRATPDMYLFLAEIADAQKQDAEKQKHLAEFNLRASEEKYGDMYNKYLALIESEEFGNPLRTISLAKREIKNRPTPQSYDLLAWGYFNQGKYAEALNVAEENIVDRTYEPDALYHLGMIYQANGKEKEGRRYLKMAAESSFELGPIIAEKIKQQLSKG